MPSAARTAVASLLAAAAAVLPVSPAAASNALPPGAGELCRVRANPPSTTHSFYSTASGDITCALPQNLTLGVCLEILEGTNWVPDGCDSGAAYGTYLFVEAIGCELGVNVYRTVAVGTAGGRTYRAESAPVVFYCAPL